MSKPIKYLADPSRAESLAKLFENLTGKRPSPAEIKAVQEKLDALFGTRGASAADKLAHHERETASTPDGIPEASTSVAKTKKNVTEISIPSGNVDLSKK